MWAGSSDCTLIPFSSRSGADHPNPDRQCDTQPASAQGTLSLHLPVLHLHIYMPKREQTQLESLDTTHYATLFGRVQARQFSMVTNSNALPVTSNSKPSSWISQAIYSRKLSSNGFDWVHFGLFLRCQCSTNCKSSSCQKHKLLGL